MTLNQKKWLVVALLFAGLICITATLMGAGNILQVLGTILLFTSLVLHFALLRCPECGIWLGRYPGDYCKICGAKIEWKKGKKE